jgi:hypothetical protein
LDASQRGEERGEIVGQRRFPLQGLPRHWMYETEAPRMQRLAVERNAMAAAVGGIADERVL